MNDALQKYLQAATGLTTVTKSKAENIAKQLVKQGEAATDNVGELVDDLLEKQRKNREAISALVKAETQRAVRAMGLATTTEVDRLQKQVADLKRELAKAESKAAASPTKSSPSKRSSAKKTSKKSSAKKSAARKKETAGGTPAKKAAKKTASKTTAKKSGAKKSTAKKSGAKKSTAKKSSS